VGIGNYIPVDDKTGVASLAVDLSPKISQAFAQINNNNENNIAARSCNHLLAATTSYIVHNSADQIPGLIQFVAGTMKTKQQQEQQTAAQQQQQSNTNKSFSENINTQTSRNAAQVLNSICLALSRDLVESIPRNQYEAPVQKIQQTAMPLLQTYTAVYVASERAVRTPAGPPWDPSNTPI